MTGITIHKVKKIKLRMKYLAEAKCFTKSIEIMDENDNFISITLFSDKQNNLKFK